MGSITLGSIFDNGITVTAMFMLVSIAFFGVTGVWLAISAFISMTTASRRPTGADGNFGWAAKLFGAVMCFAIPEAAGVSWIGLFSASTPIQRIGEQASGVTAPTNCLTSGSGGSSTNPVACVMSNIASDVVPAFDLLVMTIAASAGLWMIFIFFRSIVDKGAGAQQVGIKWGYLIVGIMFMGVGMIIHIFGGSLGFAGTSIGSAGYVSAASYLAYVPSAMGLSPQYAEMVAAGYAILASVGFYEVVHGGFILAAALNPNAQYGVGGKATLHILFGVLLVFLPLFVEATMNSGFGTSIP